MAFFKVKFEVKINSNVKKSHGQFFAFFDISITFNFEIDFEKMPYNFENLH